MKGLVRVRQEGWRTMLIFAHESTGETVHTVPGPFDAIFCR